MLITVQMKTRELSAEIKNGEVIGYKGPDITELNESPDLCLHFMQRVVEEAKRQKEVMRQMGVIK